MHWWRLICFTALHAFLVMKLCLSLYWQAFKWLEKEPYHLSFFKSQIPGYRKETSGFSLNIMEDLLMDSFYPFFLNFFLGCLKILEMNILISNSNFPCQSLLCFYQHMLPANVMSQVFLFCFLGGFLVLGFKPRPSHMLTNHSTSDSTLFLLFILRQGLTKLLRLVLDSE